MDEDDWDDEDNWDVGDGRGFDTPMSPEERDRASARAASFRAESLDEAFPEMDADPSGTFEASKDLVESWSEWKAGKDAPVKSREEVREGYKKWRDANELTAVEYKKEYLCEPYYEEAPPVKKRYTGPAGPAGPAGPVGSTGLVGKPVGGIWDSSEDPSVKVSLGDSGFMVNLAQRVEVDLTDAGLLIAQREDGESWWDIDGKRLGCRLDALMRVFGPYLYGGNTVFASEIAIKVK